MNKQYKYYKNVVSSKADFKYFIGYKDYEKVRLLLIFPPQIYIYIYIYIYKFFHKTERLYFPTKDCFSTNLKKNIIKFGKKVNNIINKEFNSKLVHNKEYLKINLEGAQYISTPLVLIDSVYIKEKILLPSNFNGVTL